MAATDINVKYVAHLARLRLTPEEELQFGEQLAHVLAYVEQLKQLDVSGVEPTAHAIPLVNVLRQDAVRPSLPHAAAMQNAPSAAGGLFVMPKFIE